MLVSAAAPADPAATTASRCAVSSASLFSSLARNEDPADLADPAAAPAAAPSAFLVSVFARGPAAAPAAAAPAAAPAVAPAVAPVAHSDGSWRAS